MNGVKQLKFYKSFSLFLFSSFLTHQAYSNHSCQSFLKVFVEARPGLASMGRDFQIRKVAMETLFRLGGFETRPQGKALRRFDREMRHMRHDPRIMSLLGVTVKTTRKHKVLPIQNPFPNVPPLLPRDISEDFEIMIRVVSKFVSENEKYFSIWSDEMGIGPVEFLDAYLRVNEIQIDRLVERAFVSDLFARHFGLPKDKAFLYGLYLSRHSVEDLENYIPKAAKAFKMSTLEFLDYYSRRFPHLPPRDLGEYGEAIRTGAKMIGLEDMLFLERLAFIDLRIQDVLIRMGVPQVAHLKALPWNTFREKIIWKIRDRELVDPNSMQSLKIMFMIDSAYAWGTEGPVRFTFSKGDLGYQVFDASANVIMAAIIDFFLSWKSMDTATGLARRSEIFKDHHLNLAREKVLESQTLGSQLIAWTSLQTLKLASRLKKNKAVDFVSELSGRMSLMGSVGVAAGLVGGGLVQSIDHIFFKLDPTMTLEDRFLATLFYSAVSGVWMGFSAAPRYMMIMKYSKFLSKRFEHDKAAAARRIAPVGIGNAIFGALGFTFLAQRPLTAWYREEGGRDQIQEYWDWLKGELSSSLEETENPEDPENPK